MRRRPAGPEAERRMFERINSFPAFLALGIFGQLLANVVYFLWRVFRPYRTGRRR